MKRAMVIQHLAFENLACFAEVLKQEQFEIVCYDASQDDLASIDPASDDLLIILGGPISANQTDIYPFLQDELDLLKQRLPLDLPTLGICLGAQLIARALGARVYPGAAKEIGWSPLTLTAAGKLSPLQHLAAPLRVLHWHGETFDLPVGSQLLASSEHYPHQAFAYGQRVLGLQFHGECTERGLESWYLGHVAEIEQTPGISVPALRAQAALYAEETVLHSQLCFADWLRRVVS